MFLADVLRSLRRRWYLVLAAVVLAAAGTYVASAQLGKTYASTASVVLVPPVDSQDPQLNRFLSLSDVTTSVDVVVRSMTSSTVVDALQKQVPGATYAITTDPTTSAPVMLVTATASTTDAAGSMLGDVLAQLPRSLRSIQDQVGIAQGRQITSLVVAKDAEPAVDNSSRKKVLLVVFAGILGILLLATAAIDGLALRRRGARRKAVPQATGPRRTPPPRQPPGELAPSGKGAGGERV